MTEYQTTVTMVRKWSDTHEPNVRAAVDLLVDHGHWLRSNDFLQKYTHVDGYSGARWIDWFVLDEKLAKNEVVGSSGELVVLKVAVMLARDTLGLSSLDNVNRDLVAHAVAMGVKR